MKYIHTGTVDSSFWKSSLATVWHLVMRRQDSLTTVLRTQCSRSSFSLQKSNLLVSCDIFNTFFAVEKATSETGKPNLQLVRIYCAVGIMRGTLNISLRPGSLRVLCSISAFPRAVLFWKRSLEDVPGICWDHSPVWGSQHRVLQ